MGFVLHFIHPVISSAFLQSKPQPQATANAAPGRGQVAAHGQQRVGLCSKQDIPLMIKIICRFLPFAAFSPSWLSGWFLGAQAQATFAPCNNYSSRLGGQLGPGPRKRLAASPALLRDFLFQKPLPCFCSVRPRQAERLSSLPDSGCKGA